MDEETKTRLTALDHKVAKLSSDIERLSAFFAEKDGHRAESLINAFTCIQGLNRQCDCLEGAIRSLKAIVDSNSDLQSHMQREFMKYDDLYYHIFPDRLAQDVRLASQLDKLNPKAAAGDDDEPS